MPLVLIWLIAAPQSLATFFTLGSSRFPGNRIENQSRVLGVPKTQKLSVVGWAGRVALPARGAESSATRPQLVNARQTRHGHRSLLALVPLYTTTPGERRESRWAPGGPVTRGTGRGILRLPAGGEEALGRGGLLGQRVRTAPPVTYNSIPSSPPSQGGG